MRVIVRPDIARSSRWRPVWLLTLLLLLAVSLSGRILPGYYIVELSEPAVAERALEEPGLPSRQIRRDGREAVLAQQRALRRMLEHFGAQTLGSVDTVANALLVRFPADQARRLASVAGVKRIYPVREMRPLLERAMPIHRVPEGWARIGGAEMAGRGVKIGIIDSGIDNTHPGFLDPSIPMPEGFPRVNRPSDLAFTSNKVIVARSYQSLFGGSAVSAEDVVGHGTAVAMSAAGVLNDTAAGPISGPAPKAWLGNYKVIQPSGSTRTDVVLKAIDDAVRDGMDVLNLSLGSTIALRPSDEILTRVFDRAAAMGVVVVVAVGNNGPGRFTIADTGVPPSAISVGATSNDRTQSARVLLGDSLRLTAVPSDGVSPVFPVSAQVLDVEQLDSNGLACNPLPGGSLSGRIAFILRGVCFFEDKLNNAAAAGAVAAVVYTDADRPDAIIMAVGDAELPGVMLSNADGVEMKTALAAAPSAVGTVDFRFVVPLDPNRVVGFSSRGPNTDLGIKPDLVATGASLNTATLDGGYGLTQGTSFSSPIVAGAAAVLLSARPGLTVQHYHSLLANAAAPLVFSDGKPAPVQLSGGGVLDLDRSLETTVAAYPTSISYGDTTGPLSRRVTISNLGTAAETYTITAQPFGSGPPPQPSRPTVSIPPHAARTVDFSVSPQGLAPGEYEGFVWIRGSRAGADIHVPYWYAIGTDEPAHINIVWTDEAGRSGGLLRGGIGMRVTDSAGIPILSPAPTVTVVSGGGGVVSVFSSFDISPGLFEVTIRLGSNPGTNTFRIEAGELSTEVSIEGQ